MFAYQFDQTPDVIEVSQELAASFAAFKNKTCKIPGVNVIAHAAYKECLRSEIIRLRLSIGKLERARHKLQICSLADIEERDYLQNRLKHQNAEYQQVLARFRTLV